ncbi:unnamed protein product [Rhodiola kirilowii]
MAKPPSARPSTRMAALPPLGWPLGQPSSLRSLRSAIHSHGSPSSARLATRPALLLAQPPLGHPLAWQPFLHSASPPPCAASARPSDAQSHQPIGPPCTSRSVTRPKTLAFIFIDHCEFYRDAKRQLEIEKPTSVNMETKKLLHINIKEHTSVKKRGSNIRDNQRKSQTWRQQHHTTRRSSTIRVSLNLVLYFNFYLAVVMYQLTMSE